MGVTLTDEECRAIYDVIDQLSGGNAGNVFAHDGTDSPDDPLTRAAAKVFAAAGQAVPESADVMTMGEVGAVVEAAVVACADAVAAEREACAKVADEVSEKCEPQANSCAACLIVEAIRARGRKP